MKVNLISLAVAGAFAMAAGSVAAEEAFQGSWYIMPQLGAVNVDNDANTRGTPVAYGIKLGKQLSEHWDVQIGGSYAKADSDKRFQGRPMGGDYKQTLFGVDALFMFSRSNFRPFLMAGLGYSHDDIDYRVNTTSGDTVKFGDGKSSWAGKLGLGAQYFFNERIAVQADVSQVWSRAHASGTIDGVRYKEKDTLSNTYMMVGLIFNFPPPPKPVVAEPAPLPVVAPVEEEVYEFKAEETVVEEGPAKPAVQVTLSAEVLFAFDKDVLKDEGKAKLDTEVVEKMKAHPEAELVMITGHTDRIGSAQYNQKLSERRANAVKKYLTSQGIEESRLHAVGKGQSDPLVDCKGVRGKKLIDCLQPNRRVVVEVERQRAVEQVTVEQTEVQGVVVEEQKQ